MTEPAFVFGAGEIALLFFVLMTCGVIGYIEHKHCHNFIRPSLQLCYMRMVLLPAVFSVCSYISYLWPHYGVFMEAVRGLPEAYALYCFYCAMVIFAGGQERLARLYETRRWADEFKRSLFCGLYKWRYTRGAEVMRWHKLRVLQLMVTKPVFTTVVAIASLGNKLDSSVKTVIVIFALANFICMFILMQTLYIVYLVMQRYLAGMNPGIKFTVIKLMVFITVTQNLIMSMLVSGGSIPAQGDLDSEEVATKLLALLGIVEMFLFSLVFVFALSAKDKSLYMRPHALQVVQPSAAFLRARQNSFRIERDLAQQAKAEQQASGATESTRLVKAAGAAAAASSRAAGAGAAAVDASAVGDAGGNPFQLAAAGGMPSPSSTSSDSAASRPVSDASSISSVSSSSSISRLDSSLSSSDIGVSLPDDDSGRDPVDQRETDDPLDADSLAQLVRHRRPACDVFAEMCRVWDVLLYPLNEKTNTNAQAAGSGNGASASSSDTAKLVSGVASDAV